MRTRALGSIIVVVVGLLPTIAGGFAFAALMLIIGLVGIQEFCNLAFVASPARARSFRWLAALLYVALAVAASVGASAALLSIILFLAAVIPLIADLPRVDEPEALEQWAVGTAGMFYIGLPLYAAIALRALPTPLDSSWFSAATSTLPWPRVAASHGLAWALLAILVIWIGDTAAYLVGRAIGARRLAPRISPGKTIEGAIGGLIGSALVAAAAFPLFGLGPAWIGALAGAVIGIMGQLGDLSESFIKRQAGQKDSGDIIPGHGGMLDRVDALLFAFPTALLLASAMETFGGPR